MVSSSHEALHRIFQEDPALFARAVKALGVSFAEPVSAVPLTTDLTENRPVERRVDTLLRMETGDNGSFLLAVESQGKQDRDKPASWAYKHLHRAHGTRPRQDAGRGTLEADHGRRPFLLPVGDRAEPEG
ncbi:hypothetical protein ACFW5U_05225 [Streptomyces rochei]|uniref:hypothetical protein n=1 Tax=Streptomyces rochei TaxID=1928 RepID=UPI0036986783